MTAFTTLRLTVRTPESETVWLFWFSGTMSAILTPRGDKASGSCLGRAVHPPPAAVQQFEAPSLDMQHHPWWLRPQLSRRANRTDSLPDAAIGLGDHVLDRRE